MNRKIRVLLADDHQIVRMGLAAIIGRERDLTVVGEARNGLEAIRLAHELSPDVVLMDIMMPRKNGAEATAAILQERPDTRILILTTFGESDEVRAALDAGATGALVKDTPHEKLVEAIRSAAAGRRTLSPDIAHALRQPKPAVGISERQVEILNLVARGLTTNAIAQTLGLGPDGVNAHLRTIFSRLGTSSRTEAVAIALREGLLRK